MLFNEIMSVHSVSHTSKIPDVNVKEDGNRQFMIVQQAHTASPSIYSA